MNMRLILMSRSKIDNKLARIQNCDHIDRRSTRQSSPLFLPPLHLYFLIRGPFTLVPGQTSLLLRGVERPDDPHLCKHIECLEYGLRRINKTIPPQFRALPMLESNWGWRSTLNKTHVRRTSS
jgi:hypothetical protein